jgi:hypothetical protein
MDVCDTGDIESTPLRHIEQQKPLYLRLLIWFGFITIQKFDSDDDIA